ncbi:MAG: EAL domain-containing protein [Oxalobacter sp.]|nr:MAG: EAL domain-containing protein [Oxalobacter sp.]
MSQNALFSPRADSIPSLLQLFSNMTSALALHEIIRDSEGKPVDYRFLDVNSAFELLIGLPREKLVGQRASDVLPAFDSDWRDRLTELAQTEFSRQDEFFFTFKGCWLAVNTYKTGANHFATMFQDISDRKKAEQHATRLTNMYRALSQTNDAIVRMENENQLFPLACRIAVDFGGMSMAWIGIPDLTHTAIVPAASYGKASAFLDGMVILLTPDEPRGQGPTALTFREGLPIVLSDFCENPMTAPWHDRGKRHGFHSSATFPLMRHGAPYAVFTVYSDQPSAFDDESVALLSEIASNLGFAMDNFDRETARRSGEISLRESEARLRLVADESPFPMMVYAEDGEIVQVNRAWFVMTQYTPLDVPTMQIWAEMACPGALRSSDKNNAAPYAVRERFDGGEQAVRCKDGFVRIWHFVTSPLGKLPDGRQYAVSMATDITESKKAEEDLRLAATVFEANYSGILITDAEGTILSVNPAFTTITGYPESEAVGQTPRLLKSGRQDADFYKTLWDTLLSTGRWQGEIWNKRKNGDAYLAWLSISAVRDNDGAPINYIAIAEDITENRANKNQIEFLAYYDSVTRLPNRQLSRERLTRAIAHAKRTDTKIALIYLDLDNFRVINDTLGHELGDALLCAFANRLSSSVRETDTVSRQGGDEFLVMLTDLYDLNAVSTVAINILEQASKPFTVDAHELGISASVGISVYPNDGNDIDTLLKSADMAMYNAKDSGRNTFRFYGEEMNASIKDHLRIRGDMTRAIERGEFILHYQPQIDLVTGELCGAEALIRWEHPELGMVRPDRFIQVAEQSGLIIPLGAWVIREACRQAMAWQRAGLPPFVVAVNISALQFRRGDLVQTVSDALSETGLIPELLELELTESLLLQDLDRSLDIVDQFKTLGVKMSIDDFGTGYSSLAYLQRLSLEKLKIDQSFIRDVPHKKSSAAIVMAIISLAQTLDKTVIAEGVETAEQLAFLRTHLCNEAQGYFFSRPLPPDEFATFMKNWKPAPLIKTPPDFAVQAAPH